MTRSVVGDVVRTESDSSGDILVVKCERECRVPRGCSEFMVILCEDRLSGFGSLAFRRRQVGHVTGSHSYVINTLECTKLM